jgi:hypothetical protein
LTKHFIHSKIAFQQTLKWLFLMKISTEQLEDRAKEAIQLCLSKIPFLRIEGIKKKAKRGDKTPDFLLKLGLPDGEQYLLVELRNNGQPRLAREAVNQILRYRDIFPGAYGVFVAPYVSPRAAEICAGADIGYLDLAGNCRLCFGQVFVEKQGNRNPFAQKRDLRSLYSPKAERVLRVLLNNPSRAWKIAELSAEAKVSLGQVSNVKKLLADREWIGSENAGFILVEPEQLLKEWSENYSFKRNRIQDYYSLKNVAEIEVDLAEACNRIGLVYALTSFSGAARLAPAVRYQRAFAYVGETEEDLPSTLGLKKVKSGANVSLLYPYDDGVFYGSSDFESVRIASPVQIYLDVSSYRGRGEEAANWLLKKVLIPEW